MVGLELPNLRDPVELNVTLPWALGIFRIMTLPAMDPQTALSLRPFRMWSVIMITVIWPATYCVRVCFCVRLCVHVLPFDLLYAYGTLTIENLWLFRSFTTLYFKDWSIFQPNYKTVKKISHHYAVWTTYCLWR